MSRILLSALSARRGGGLTYIRHIVGSFPAAAGHRLSVLSVRPVDGLATHPGVDWVNAPLWAERPIWRFLLGSVYFRWLWPLRHEFDAVYFAGGSFDVTLPRGARRIVAFRNMLPFDRDSARQYPLGWMRFRHWLLRYAQAWAFRRADLVIFISDYARRIIDAAVPRRRGGSVVIPHGATRTTAPLHADLASRLPKTFVLYLSILEVYKAQVELVEAWAIMKRGRPGPEKLVLAGPEYPPYAAKVRAAISRLELDQDVILLGPVPHDQISDLARRATLNVFLSVCENCPNILLELMCAGTPLLVSSREPMPELGGPRLRYVEPYDVSAVARSLSSLLDDPAARERLARAAEERGRLYTWQRAGEQTWDAILSCIAVRPRASYGNSSFDHKAEHVQG